MGKSSGKFLPLALRLITDEGDVETHGDNNHLTHGVAFLYLPQCLNWTRSADSNVRPSYVLAANTSFLFPSFKSSMKNGKKTRSLSSMSRPIGKTILCGMVFVMKTATPYKDSGENCAIPMSPTGKPSTFWGAPKPKPFHG